MRTSKFMSISVFLTAVMLLSAGMALAGPPDHAKSDKGKVWLCHFEDDHEWQGVGDRNGALEGFWTVNRAGYPVAYLTGDYVVKWNASETSEAEGVPNGLNSGQVNLCTGVGGEFMLVSVNALGSADDTRGHRAQLVDLNVPTYPAGWKG